MKARIQLVKSDQPDATLFSLSNVLYINDVFNDINRLNVTYCDMLLVTKESNIKYNDYCLINDHGSFIVEKCDKIVTPQTIGVRDVFIGQAGTVSPMDNVEKIIASTCYDRLKDLPKIHDVFIEIFVKLNNDGNKITDVNVVTDKLGDVKVKSNNTVIIQKYDENDGRLHDAEEEHDDNIEDQDHDITWVNDLLALCFPNKKTEEDYVDEDEDLENEFDIFKGMNIKVLDSYTNDKETSMIFKFTIPKEFNEELIEKLAILQEMGIMK